ncbi:unnamed protein product [Adineta ricciae]|uniref:G-protein coupled receptors family 1 profile domain-containing protein n=1 Tax=Adineta ricciae TaxID=249248 RepID=A0A815VRX0_ADIRI|nr:unnamed protein product [Adineta ricciae]CAF1541681.1 unnamed protein product [Adineta ricciae]
MTTSSMSFYTYLTGQITIYTGFTILIFGVIGSLLNLIVFLSLQTFRKSSCAFYLIFMSLANLLHLLMWLPGHIIIYGFENDWSATSAFLCKSRFYFFQLWILISFTSICLAMIDQFLSTSSNPLLNRCCNIKLARNVIIGSIIVWFFHGIPFALYMDIIPLSFNSNLFICVNTNTIFSIYFSFGFILLLMGILPLTVMIIFGLLTYYNVKTLAYRTVPLVRRELDKQLTQMVLVQVIFNSIILSPYIMVFIAQFDLPSNDFTQFLFLSSVNLHTFYFASPFYIYMCVSKRFRQQFKYVFYKIHFNRWRQLT